MYWEPSAKAVVRIWAFDMSRLFALGQCSGWSHDRSFHARPAKSGPHKINAAWGSDQSGATFLPACGMRERKRLARRSATQSFGADRMTPYLINPNAAHVWPVTQSSPAKPPATPSTPVHRFVLIHLSSFGGLLRKVPLSAKVFISLILSRSTHIDHVPRRVRDNVVGLPLFLDHGYLASFKLLELMLLRGGLGGNHLKA